MKPKMKRKQSRRSKCPPVDIGFMDELFRSHVKKMGIAGSFELGPYNALHTQNAINGSALSKLKELVGVLMKLETGLQFKFSDLKGSLQRCCLQFPDLRKKVEESKRCDYEGNMASALLCVCAHTRRLKDSTRFREACSKCTDYEKKELLEMKNWLCGEQNGGDDKATWQNSVWDPSNSPVASSDPFSRSFLHLIEASVAVSTDLPSLPATPVMTTPKKRKAAASPTPDKKRQSDLDEEAEIVSPLPARKGKLKDKVLKRPAAALKKPATASPWKKPAVNKGNGSWLLMYYKVSKSRAKPSWAVRESGGCQLFQLVAVPGKDVKKICQKAIEKLLDGEVPGQVREWAKAQ